MTLLTQQMAERRDRILASARNIIAQNGAETLTMRALAEQSRVTVPTIYNLIGSKEEVLLAVVEDQSPRFQQAIENIDAPTPAERALAVAEGCVRELLRSPRYYRSLLSVLVTAEGAGSVQRAVDRILRAAYESALTELEEAGQLESWVDKHRVADQLRAQLHVNALQWVGGDYAAEGFRAAAVYGSCLILLAVTCGKAKSELQVRAQSVQPKAHHSRRRELAKTNDRGAAG